VVSRWKAKFLPVSSRLVERLTLQLHTRTSVRFVTTAGLSPELAAYAAD
jgi:hypothetical protein